MQNLNMNPLNKLNFPIQQILELNQKTLRKFSYMEPETLTQIHDPNTFVEKNVQIFIENSHASIDYMHQLFNIFESSWINLSNVANEKTKDILHKTQSATTSAINKMGNGNSKQTPSKHTDHSSKKNASSSSSSKSKHKAKSKLSNADKKHDTHKAVS